MSETKQTALILEGGALRRVYTSGVLDVLMLHHVKIPNVVGISAGSLNGSSFARLENPIYRESRT